MGVNDGLGNVLLAREDDSARCGGTDGGASAGFGLVGFIGYVGCFSGGGFGPRPRIARGVPPEYTAIGCVSRSRDLDFGPGRGQMPC